MFRRPKRLLHSSARQKRQEACTDKIDKGLVQNLTREQNLTAQLMPRFVQSILEAGGIENYLKTHDGFEV
jgi:hypothetical protein